MRKMRADGSTFFGGRGGASMHAVAVAVAAAVAASAAAAASDFAAAGTFVYFFHLGLLGLVA